jgi:hypothetical protein
VAIRSYYDRITIAAHKGYCAPIVTPHLAQHDLQQPA